nr:estradiol 17-beta-dehydrogenase 8-like [Pelodiscus sinensis]|eukprot:XP_014428129.1 estradiol 17-beta-dehydrogenase 8-like [Pelodiscus sinensis]
MDQFMLKQTEEAFDEVIRVNLKGTFLVTQAVARGLVDSGAPGGSIVNIGSVVGKVRAASFLGQCPAGGERVEAVSFPGAVP